MQVIEDFSVNFVQFHGIKSSFGIWSYHLRQFHNKPADENLLSLDTFALHGFARKTAQQLAPLSSPI
jgi:hypothetical protein